jgi:DNA-binding beta-propeller fold protein YncE
MNLRLPVLSISCLAAAVVSNPIGHAQQAQRLLYAGVPGVGNAIDHGGIGILVFDIDHGYKFIKRIPTWSSSDGRVEGVRGIAATAATGRLFVSTSRRLAAIDLATDKVVWEQNFGGKCCDRMAISPDGSTLYAPAAGAPKWYVVNAADGALIATVDKEGSPHNTIYSDDGRYTYLENQGRVPPYISRTGLRAWRTVAGSEVGFPSLTFTELEGCQ